MQYLKDNGLLPDLQSAYRAHHSTKTALLKVLSDILLTLDSGNLAMLTLLNLSAAFDSVDHDTLLQRLKTSYGLKEAVLDWFESYLRGCVQEVRSTTSSSMPSQAFSCCTESPKVQSLDRSCFFCTQLIFCS